MDLPPPINDSAAGLVALTNESFLDAQPTTLSSTFLSIFLGLMTVCSVVGNVLVILSVALNRKLRTVTNCFIVSLAVADLLVAISVMPISAVVEVTGEWVFGRIICWTFISADVFLCTSSIWNLVIISLERCMAISWPLWYGSRRTKRIAYILIAIAWIISMVICIPPLFLQGILEGAAAGDQCHYAIDEYYRIYSACGSFWIPLVIILFCYIRIFSVANRKDKALGQDQKMSSVGCTSSNGVRPLRPQASIFRRKRQPSSPSTNSVEQQEVLAVSSHNGVQNHVLVRGTSITETTLSSSTALIEIHLPGYMRTSNGSLTPNGTARHSVLSVERPFRSAWQRSSRLQRQNTRHSSSMKQTARDRERKVFRVLLIILCSFVACWMGFFVIYTLEPFCEACKGIDKRVYAFFLWLGYFNSMLNPLIYAGFSQDFRRAFLNILLCAVCRHKTSRLNRRPTLMH